MKRYEYYMILQQKYTDINVFSEIERTCRKIEEHFETHNNILVSVSGGSDSDCIVHLICTYFPEYVEKCRFVFDNTGLEYDATKRHLCDLEKRYGITIDRIRGESVVTKENAIDLNVTGERRAEGGQRATAHKSCFHETHEGAKFMPLFWWSDMVKAVFKKAEKIRYSDCYEVYGMKIGIENA